MMVVTGAASFIGSCLISRLNRDNFNYIVAVDDFSNPEKNKNLEGKHIKEHVDWNLFFDWLDKNQESVEFIFHTSVTDAFESAMGQLTQSSLDYSKRIWEACCRYQIPLIYGSSAATYGQGEFGYDDKEDIVESLQPLTPYGIAENEFDKWAIRQSEKPFFWAGIKLFNVYGPNEYYKQSTPSVVLRTFRNIKQTGSTQLFCSHHPAYKDGEQLRDFIYVKDVVEVIFFLMKQRKHSGIYNLGTGKARTFLDMTRATFKAMGRKGDVSFIDTPADIRDKYQYFTEANMAKLKSIGYNTPFYTLEEGIADYVQNYLEEGDYY